ncbi:MAG: class III signal peptide-containing protein [archaeon]|jgi:hypothetical protein
MQHKTQTSIRGQGAIEYLLILAASIVVVAVVISYMIGILDLGGGAINKQTLDGLCASKEIGGLDQNTLLCGCYLKDSTKGEINENAITIMASAQNCPEKLPERHQTNPLLEWN